MMADRVKPERGSVPYVRSVLCSISRCKKKGSEHRIVMYTASTMSATLALICPVGNARLINPAANRRTTINPDVSRLLLRVPPISPRCCEYVGFPFISRRSHLPLTPPTCPAAHPSCPCATLHSPTSDVSEETQKLATPGSRPSPVCMRGIWFVS